MKKQTGRPTPVLPWAERHRPRHLGQVVGNTEQVRKLAEWLRDWDDVVMKGQTKTAPPPEPGKEWQKYRPVENLNARAALISGPPGIGKTTTSVLVAKCNPKYSCKEFNASDARSKKVVEEMSKSLAGNTTLRMGAKAGQGSIERSVIIMDECDGMAGGDAGGMQALINMIKTTKSPIICICNDRGDQAVRNLSAVCLDIKFKRPENTVVAKRMKAILEGEGKRVDLLALEAIVEACGHDIRQVLNQVQFFGTSTAHKQGSQKDTQVMASPFDAAAKLLAKEDASKPMTMNDKFNYFYIDADFMPLMIQENYLRPYEKSTKSLEAADINKCAYAAECISIADFMQSTGDWGLQSSVAAIGTIYPAFLTSEEGGFSRPAFPAWLQKRAPMNRASRLAQEMYSHIQPFTTCSRKNLSTSGYLDVLHRRLLRPLNSGDAKSCAAMLHGYGLTREFFTDQAPALRAPLNLDDAYKRVDGKARNTLLTELQELQANAKGAAKRVATGGDGGPARKKNRGGDAGDTQADTADGDGDMEDGGSKKKAAAPKKKKLSKEAKEAACSLGGWVKKEEKFDVSGNIIVPKKREAGILLKFIEGHTQSVRRKVHMEDIIGPWRQF